MAAPSPAIQPMTHNRVVGVVALTVAVADLEASVRRNAALLGLSPPAIRVEDVAGQERGSPSRLASSPSHQ